MGHVINNSDHSIYIKIIRTLERYAISIGIPFNKFIQRNISTYAIKQNDSLKYTELVSEVNSLLKSDKNNDIIKSLKEEGVL